MPNWCSNTVYLSHETQEKIDALCAELEKEKPEFFDAIMRTPQDLLNGEGWHMWRVERWGTKWNPSIYDFQKESDGSLRIEFDTAWAPPIGIYEHLTENGFKVDACYSEDGMCFRGTYTSESGDFCEDYEPEEEFA